MIPTPEQLDEISRLREGALQAVPFSVLLLGVSVHRRTLVIEVRRKQISKRIVFENGVPVDCRSNLVHETLGRYLVAQGKLAAENLHGYLSQSAAHGLPLGEVLLEHDVISAEELYKVLQQNLAKKLLDIFTWRDGEFRAHAEVPRLDSPLKIRVPQLIVTGITKFAPQEEVDAGVVPLVGKKLCLHPEPPFALDDIRLGQRQSQVAVALRSGWRIDELALGTGMPFEEITRLLYALAVLGVVITSDHPAARVALRAVRPSQPLAASGGTAGGRGAAVAEAQAPAPDLGAAASDLGAAAAAEAGTPAAVPHAAIAPAAAGETAAPGNAHAEAPAQPAPVAAVGERLPPPALHAAVAAAAPPPLPETAAPAPLPWSAAALFGDPLAAPGAPGAPTLAAAAAAVEPAGASVGQARSATRPVRAVAPEPSLPERRRNEIMQTYLSYRRLDSFDLLGADEEASPAEVEGKYLEMAQRFAPWELAGPDLAGMEEKARDIFLAGARAYAELLDLEQRNALLFRRRAKREERSRPPADMAIKTDLLDPEVQYRKGRALMDTGKFQEAAVLLEFASDCDPQNGLYSAELAHCRFCISPGQGAKAIRELQETLRRDPECGLAVFYAGEIHRQMGNRAEAEPLLRRAIKMMAPDRRPIEALKALAADKRK